MMVRAVVLIVVFMGLLTGSAISEEFKAVMALAGIAATCVWLNWLTKRER